MLLMTLTLAAGCRQETPVATDTRQSIDVDYVVVQEMAIHKSPDTASAVVSHQSRGESVSVLAKKDGWLEVRTFDGGSGWARSSDASSKAADPEADSTAVHFRLAPQAVSNPTARGELWFEARVNTDGDVVDVKTVSNTTGSTQLEAQNREALLHAKFEPLRDRGKVQAFTYDYHVQY
jgi:SH3-like domain-containing protein